jgi:GntR family transcriptional regulator
MYNSRTVITHGGQQSMKLIISNISGVPIYEQIKRQVKSAILSGELQEEEMLPSLRTLAKDLKISVLTVTRAYTELEQEGFVKNMQGRGCFVMGRGSELIREQLICKVEDNLTEAVKAARMANLSTEELHHLLDILMEVKTDD